MNRKIKKWVNFIVENNKPSDGSKIPLDIILDVRDMLLDLSDSDWTYKCYAEVESNTNTRDDWDDDISDDFDNDWADNSWHSDTDPDEYLVLKIEGNRQTKFGGVKETIDRIYKYLKMSGFKRASLFRGAIYDIDQICSLIINKDDNDNLMAITLHFYRW